MSGRPRLLVINNVHLIRSKVRLIIFFVCHAHLSKEPSNSMLSFETGIESPLSPVIGNIGDIGNGKVHRKGTWKRLRGNPEPSLIMVAVYNGASL